MIIEKDLETAVRILADISASTDRIREVSLQINQIEQKLDTIIRCMTKPRRKFLGIW